MWRVRRAFADTPHGQIHYRYSGDSTAPAVVLFHDSPLSSQIYDPVLPLLGERFFAVAPDTPGYGDSDPPECPLGMPEYAARLLAFVRGLRMDRFFAIGSHTGGSIAVELAAQAPGLIQKLVVIGPVLYSPEERQHMLATYIPALEPQSDGSHLQWLWQRQQLLRGADSPPQLLQDGLIQYLKAGARWHWAYQAAFRHDPAPLLRTLQIPVLYLVAEQDVLARYNEQAVSITPNARAHVIPGLKGQLPERVPEQLAQIVCAFFDE